MAAACLIGLKRLRLVIDKGSDKVDDGISNGTSSKNEE